MIFIFLIFVIIFLLGIRYKNFNKEYLDKNNTAIINGLFIIIVFFSHFHQYIEVTNNIDIYFYKFISLIGQLMVTTFLFYSGYGIYESIKKKDNYINNFFKNRFVPTFINWLIALSLFLIVNLVMKNELSISRVLLSIIGWDAIGNSNWYMFDIFVLYILVIATFKIIKNKKYQLITITILTLMLILVLFIFKESHWYNTLLCFPLGIIYSYFKDKIDLVIMKNNKNYLIYLIISIIMFCINYIACRYINIRCINILYNLLSCFFVLMISILLMKFELKSKIIYWFGKNLFWVYILQRIPMMVLKGKISNIYLYFCICLIITILMVLIINYIKSKLKKDGKNGKK